MYNNKKKKEFRKVRKVRLFFPGHLSDEYVYTHIHSNNPSAESRTIHGKVVFSTRMNLSLSTVAAKNLPTSLTVHNFERRDLHSYGCRLRRARAIFSQRISITVAPVRRACVCSAGFKSDGNMSVGKFVWREFSFQYVNTSMPKFKNNAE